MFTWKDYYAEVEQRLNQLDEARHYRLIKAFLNMNETRLRNSPFRIQPAQFVHIKETSYEYK
jgi:hypothetical protein